MGIVPSIFRMKTNEKKKVAIDRYKFSKSGKVVRDTRRTSALFNTDAYRSGDPIYATRRSSPARLKFHEESNALRSVSKPNKVSV
jgi:hypothetical protein